jgi:hypothetical protein
LVLVETTAAAPQAMDALLDLLRSLSRALLEREIPHTVGWQEGGQYVTWEVTDTEGEVPLLDRLLGSPPERGGQTAVSCCAASRQPYAHVAVLAAELPPDLDLLCRTSRVTLLTPAHTLADIDVAASDVNIIYFTEEMLTQGGLFLEL